ncbi:protein lingerer isoform X2 [Ctenocephalides felis]|uniref:protein lingerer isoform X2 n=1 Tax=Ctenocephalides felis TaxID=7515 RepID=UPI000E6E1064|nr:protein lingerer isoform X2 [Ctenocephalides felis]
MSSGTRIQRSSGGTNNKGTSINNLTNSVTNKNQNAVSTKNKLNSASGQDTVKNQDKIQPTAEQMRIAQIMDVRTDDPGIREKVITMMETTFRSEEEVCSALHDCDNDVDRAVNLLFESTNSQTAWETSVKKKKNRLNSTSGNVGHADSRNNNMNNVCDTGEDWDHSNAAISGAGDDQSTGQNNVAGHGSHRGSGRGRGPRGGRRGNLDSRGWRGREARENDRNNHQDDGTHPSFREGGGGYHRDRRGGRGGGRGYGGRGGRGGRAGGAGGRSFQSRLDSRSQHRNQNEDQVECWDDVDTNTQFNNGKTDNFPSPEDWDNEEYTGSLADTKVFTPSENPIPEINPNAQSAADNQQYLSEVQYSSAVVSSGPHHNSLETHDALLVPGNANNISNHALPEIHPPPTAAQQLTQALEIHSNPTQVSGSLSAEQTQYFTTLTQQNSQSCDIKGQQQTVNMTYGTTTGSSNYISNAAPVYGVNQHQINYGNGNPSYAGAVQEATSNVSQQRKQRARVPPPSKIPATAVEMPADLNTSVGFLDVQFGALEFGSDTSSFESNLDSTNSSIISNSKFDSSISSIPVSQQQLGSTHNVDASLDSSYKPTPSNTSQTSQKVAGDTMTQISDHNLSSVPNYSSQNRSSNSVTSCISPANANNSTVADQLSSKTDNHTFNQPVTNTVSQFQTNSYSKSQSAYQTSTPYYSNTQQQSVNSYGASQTLPSGYISNNSVGVGYPNTSSVSANVGSYSSQSISTASAVSTAPAGYSSQSVPNVTGVQLGYSSQSTFMNQQVGSYPAQNQNSYQNTTNNQSVYGTNSALANNTSSYSTSSSIPTNITSGQYNSYSTNAGSHKLSNKDSQYDNPVSSVSGNLVSTSASVSSPVLGLATTVSKSNNSTGNSNKTPIVSANSSSVMVSSSATSSSAANSGSGSSSGITAGSSGVPVQYIMGQAGVPFYQQPLYSFEELQMLQQRMPHMATGYYNMGYQTPTTLSTGREGTIGSVAYSMPDGRFTRADSNASPVPSTLSQPTATGQHTGGPILNPTLPPGYMEAYYYGGGMLPGSYQYGTPTLYPQMATTANAHGSTTNSGYPKPSYSGYNAGYESLSQSQDYTKPSGSYGPGGSVSGTTVVPQVSGKSNTTTSGSVGPNSQGANVQTGANNTDIASAMYNKTHTALNKVNSYEKQTFHSGTPPPFNMPGSGSSGTTYGAPHLFIPTMAPHQQAHHNTQMLHQPLHQIYGGTSQVSHRDSGNGSGQRTQSSSQQKSSGKQGYSQSPYWTPN